MIFIIYLFIKYSILPIYELLSPLSHCCPILKRDTAYSLLNLFWILVGLMGIARAGGLL